METATAILNSFDSILERFELCTKQELFKVGVRMISFILGTFDMVTDWINWKQWSFYGGYNLYHFVFIFQTTFLCAAVVGTILWAVEVYLMIKRSRESIQRYQKRSFTTETLMFTSTQESEHTSLSSRVGFTVRLFVGLMEDLPVVILLYYSMIIPFCGTSRPQERSSSTTIATVVSSMLNAMWTMFILFWDLCGCSKKISNADCFCIVIRCIYEKTSLFVCYCEGCGCVTPSNCRCFCLGRSCIQKSPNYRNFQSRCKKVAFSTGKVILIIIIILLYLAIFILGGMTLSNAFYAPVLERSIMVDQEYSKSIKSDKIGPELDFGTDAAMFINMVYELPNWYHVGLYDNRNINIANSASVNQIQNRLYIGQFKELEHLKDGSLTNVIPCNRAFPFLKQIDESLFQFNNSQKINFTDFSNCKLIFRLRYYPTNNNWNPFVNFIHDFFKYITIEWGIYIKDGEMCPTGFKPLPFSSLLTDTVKQDILNYTCSPACINATDICRRAAYGTFEKSDSRIPSTPMLGEPDLYLTVNDQQTEDGCQFETNFEYTKEFCNIFWTDYSPVKVPDYVRNTYPQFITFPMTYKKKEKYLFDGSKCMKLWAEWEKMSL